MINSKCYISVGEPWDFESSDGPNILKGRIIRVFSPKCVVFEANQPVACKGYEGRIFVLHPRYYNTSFDQSLTGITVNGAILTVPWDAISSEEDLEGKVKYAIIGGLIMESWLLRMKEWGRKLVSRLLGLLALVVTISCSRPENESIELEKAGPLPLVGQWQVIDVKSTFTQLGVLPEHVIDFSDEKATYKGQVFTISERYICFPSSLKNTASFADTVLLQIPFTAFRVPASEQLMRYPGHELNIDPESLQANRPIVGAPFMELLGNKDTALIVFPGKGRLPNNYEFYLCVSKPDTIGLFLANSQTLLLMKRRK